MEDVTPKLDTLRFFEGDGSRYRIYVTVGGAIACDRFDEKLRAWKHMPLREANECELAEVLKLRYKTEDEAIARAVAAHDR